MPRARPVSIVFYAINGRGLGHLTRLLAVARAARELCDALEVPADFSFLTTSEATSLAEDFPVYKLPSKTALGKNPRAREKHLGSAKLLVSNLVASLAPDLLVLDTVPYGAFQELAFLKSYASATAYIYRHSDERVARSEVFQRHLELFDRILIPDDESAFERQPVPRSARERVRAVGPICAFSPDTAWDRMRTREHFGVPPDRRLIYVAAGGGGDGRDALATLIDCVAGDERNVVLAGHGPLHRGACHYAANVIPLLEADVWRYFPGVDAAVSAAGENSFRELLAAGVPTAFFAQEKGLDRQDLRIARAVEDGVALALSELDPTLVRARVDDLISKPLVRRAPPEGALVAAVELLSMCALERNELYEAAAWRRAFSTSLGASFVDAARTYREYRAASAGGPEVAAEQDRAAASWWAGAGEPSACTIGAELSELRGTLALDGESWRCVLQAFRRPERAVFVDALRAVAVAGAGERLDGLIRTTPKAALAERIRALADEADQLLATAE